MGVRATPHALIVSQLHGQRLREEGLRGEPIILSGIYTGSFEPDADAAAPREPLVVFAGRHIPEKRVDALPRAIAAARERIPGLRARIFGDGPERPRVLRAITDAGLDEVVEAPGFVSGEEVHHALAEASCHVLPSRREGYGLVVIEAAAAGTPTIVVAEPDNAAVERIENGVNGFVVNSLDELPEAIVRVHEAGTALRESTADWFRRNAKRLSAAESARLVAQEYGRSRALPGAQGSRARSAPS
jgi:glycosyltransferase involved in cell wall biosynthesis